MKKKWFIISVIAGIVLIGIVTLGPIMSNVEVPSYQVVNAENNIKVRQYSPMIVAEVEIKGQRENAISDGFRLLADYIFGNNINHKNIAMTAPVQQQEIDDMWRISFIIPSEYKMKTLPTPISELIRLQEVSAQMFAVITFNGQNSDKNLKKHEEKLIEYIQSQNLLVRGESKYAFYNPAWTLPFMRRNEVMIEVISQ